MTGLSFYALKSIVMRRVLARLRHSRRRARWARPTHGKYRQNGRARSPHRAVFSENDAAVRVLASTAFLACIAAGHAAGTWYVTTNGAGSFDGSHWTNAFSNIQDGISAAVDGSSGDYATVLVSNGIYKTGGLTVDAETPFLTNRIAINARYITVRSANNDPTNTIIEGAWDPVTTNGSGAIRGVYMTNFTRLIGFTVTKGATLHTNDTDISTRIAGGGIRVYASSQTAIISNCVIVSNSSSCYGAGVNGGSCFNCEIKHNTCWRRGGGAHQSVLSNCFIAYNTATYSSSGDGGAGGNRSDFWNCRIISNSAPGCAGNAIYYGNLYNCVVAYNYSGSYAVMYADLVQNCLVYGNQGTYAVHLREYNKVESSTIIRNSNRGVSQGNAATNLILNCVVYSNSYANNWSENANGKLIFSNTCVTADVLPKNFATLEEFLAAGNTTNNPILVDFGTGYGTSHVEGDYRLHPASPCVNRGLNQSWMAGAGDRDGNPRIRNRVVDMGCYETFLSGSIYSIR